MSRAFLTPIGVVPLSSNPASGTAGDIYYNSGDGTLRYYNGSSWVVVSTGSGGGATMSTTEPSNPTNGQIWVDIDSDVLSADPIVKSIVDAKGDIVTATGSDTPARLAVGANERRLVADSAETTGLKWVADTTNYVVSAKGDLIVGTAADTVTRVGIGTKDQVLYADPSTASGVSWGDVVPLAQSIMGVY